MTCRFPNDCPEQGSVLVRITGVGDRRVCAKHLAWMTENGQDFRVLPTEAFVPLWRQRDLSRDESGRNAA